VVYADGTFCGIVSRRHLMSDIRKKVILIDHNEKNQSVAGIENAEIIEIIRDFHKEFAYEDKMSGTSKYTFLSLYIKRQKKTIQQAFIDFFMREIKDNKYGFFHDALAIFRCLNNKQVILKLFDIFIECYKNDKYCKDIFLLLIRLGDTDPDHIVIFTDYVHKKLVQNIALNYMYIIDYMIINANDALLILSDFYINFLTKEQVSSWNNIYIFTLAHFFMRKDLSPLLQLIDMTYEKNKSIGVLLKKLLLEYAIFSPCKNKEEWLQKKKLQEKLEYSISSC
jgi:hypothetical protein